MRHDLLHTHPEDPGIVVLSTVPQPCRKWRLHGMVTMFAPYYHVRVPDYWLAFLFICSGKRSADYRGKYLFIQIASDISLINY